jgi:hypothetical protein
MVLEAGFYRVGREELHFSKEQRKYSRSWIFLVSL